MPCSHDLFFVIMTNFQHYKLPKPYNSLLIHEENTKENHNRVGGFTCDNKLMLIYINFSFHFLASYNVDFENYFANELIRWVAF